MKFSNTLNDLIIWDEFMHFKLITGKIVIGMINAPFVLFFIYDIFNSFNTYIIQSYEDKDIFMLLIYILLFIISMTCAVYILFVVEPKMLKHALKKKCIKISKKDKDFNSEKEVIIEEKLIKIITKNKESQIVINRNTKMIRYQNYIFIADFITKKMPIHLHPLIIPIKRLNPEDIIFINELKIEILNFNK